METTLERTPATRRGPVRITMPAKVANDLGLLKESIVSIAELLGCPRCFSGVDCRLEQARRFAIDASAKVRELPDPGEPIGLPSDPVPWRTGAPVQVSLAPRVDNDIDALQGAVERVVNILGCPACCSGFDILLQRELDLIHVDDQLNTASFGAFA